MSKKLTMVERNAMLGKVLSYVKSKNLLFVRDPHRNGNPFRVVELVYQSTLLRNEHLDIIREAGITAVATNVDNRDHEMYGNPMIQADMTVAMLAEAGIHDPSSL